MFSPITFIAFPVVYVLYLLWKVGRRESGLPPGPATLPFIGNLNIIPQPKLYMRATEWAKTYGEIISLKAFNRTMIILSSPSAIQEVLDKHGAATADRPQMNTFGVVTDRNYLVFMRSEKTNLSNSRKSVQILMSSKGIEKRRKIQYAETTVFLRDLLRSPENYYEHIYRTVLSSLLSSLFGSSQRAPQPNSEIVVQFQEYTRRWAHFLSPETIHPIDLFPFLRHVPESWASWQKRNGDMRRMQQELFFELFDGCARRTDSGARVGCYMEHIIDHKDEFGLKTREQLAYHAGNLVDAGTDTTAGFIRALALLLVAHPDCQQNGREEIDQVVGEDRLPTLDDLKHLPYVQAIISETHRFRPGVPLSVPHAATKDLSYNGYSIPKGSTILMNMWSIFHNPEYFDDPDEFRPERFLITEHGTKPGVDAAGFRATLPFGAGRRICPGMNMGNDSAALALMGMLWAFDLSPAKDGVTGEEIPVDINNFEEGITFMALPCVCRIEVRSKVRADLIEKEATVLFPADQ